MAAGGKWSTLLIWAEHAFTLGRADYPRPYGPILYGWKEGAEHYGCGAGIRAPCGLSTSRPGTTFIPP